MFVVQCQRELALPRCTHRPTEMLAGDTKPLLNARPPDYAAFSAVAGMVAAAVVVTIAASNLNVHFHRDTAGACLVGELTWLLKHDLHRVRMP